MQYHDIDKTILLYRAERGNLANFEKTKLDIKHARTKLRGQLSELDQFEIALRKAWCRGLLKRLKEKFDLRS